MNIVNTEIQSVMIARTCSCKAKIRKVTYAFVDPYYTICLDKKGYTTSWIGCMRKATEVF